jgi:hypothetical protein
VKIRAYQPGDEAPQVAIYNAVTEGLPAFKPAHAEEHRRRIKTPGFDPQSRLYATEGDRVVGYITVQENGRVSYPWTLPGFESAREALFEAILNTARRKKLDKLFTAYRADWESIHEYFLQKGFAKKRDMVNFVQQSLDLPTMVNRRGVSTSHLTKEDIPYLVDMVPGLIPLPEDRLEKYFFANPFFSAESIFVVRKPDGTPQTIGILVIDSQYADATKLDANMPCFRLGAFGTEGMTTKRINGLFSFVAPNQREALQWGLDLMFTVLDRLGDTEIESLAAQVPSDVPHLLRFYESYFRKQGSFPVFEKKI